KQEQLKSINPTLEQQTIRDSNENNQNDDDWKSVPTRTDIKKSISNHLSQLQIIVEISDRAPEIVPSQSSTTSF
ncbi:unnamed protein product, partial [Rotaria sordida]